MKRQGKGIVNTTMYNILQVFLLDWLSELGFNACLSVIFFSQLLLLTNAGLKRWPRGLYRIYGQKDGKIETLALRTLNVQWA